MQGRDVRFSIKLTKAYLCNKIMKYLDIKYVLKNKVVGIAGCGGLGSNCAMALVRTGLGRLVLADHDRLEEGNLNRQYFFRDQLGEHKVSALKENIHRVDTDCEVEAHVIQLEPASVIELFAECDVIVEAFDTDHAKQMIIETVLSEFPGKAIVSGQGLAGFGNNESITTRRLDDLYIIGDGELEVTEDQPPLGPRVAVVANMQANLVVELLLKGE